MRGRPRVKAILAIAKPALLLVVLAAVLTTIVLLATSPASAEWGDVILVEDFDQEPIVPDPDQWEVILGNVANLVEVDENALWVHVVGGSNAHVQTVNPIPNTHFSIEFDWLKEYSDGRPLEVMVFSTDGTGYREFFTFFYDDGVGGWSVRYYRSGSLRTWKSHQNSAEDNTWYHVDIEVQLNTASVKVSVPRSGVTVYEKDDIEFNDLYSSVKVRLGASTDHNYDEADATFDNLTFVDRTPEDVKPIQCAEPPKLVPREGEPFEYDFTSLVTDLDGDITDLYFTSRNPVVTEVDGLHVTFEFDDGPIDRQVTLTLSDGIRAIEVYVDFIVTPTNDPPEWPVILQPLNNSKSQEGDDITFEVTCDDVDDTTVYMTFQSDLSGIFKVGNVIDHIKFKSSFLDVGTHRITVTADDGDVKRSRWIIIEVEEPSSSNEGDSVDSVNLPLIICASLSLVAFVLVLTLTLLYKKGQKEIAARTAARRSVASPAPSYRSSSTYKSSRSATRSSYEATPVPWGKSTTAATRTSARKPATKPAPKLEPNPDLEDFDFGYEEPKPPAEPAYRSRSPQAPVAKRAPPAKADVSWRVSSIDEFIKLVQQLPAGLPEPLWGVDWGELARAVMASSMEDVEGRPVAIYKGRKFHADKRNLRTFMQEAD